MKPSARFGWLLAFLLLTLFAISSYGQTTVTVPKGFVETVPPKAATKEWFALNSSQNEFAVSIVDGKLDVKKAGRERKSELKIAGGTLVGINKGEWGGQLTFHPEDTTKKAVDIKEGNIKFLFKFKDEIYFIEGLAHMGTNSGALYRLDTSNDNFTFTKLIDFDSAPQAFTIYNDKFFIATHGGFYIVQDFKEELVFKDMFWRALYPNSIAAFDEENVFLGMRGGIMKLDLVNKTVKFYKNGK